MLGQFMFLFAAFIHAFCIDTSGIECFNLDATLDLSRTPAFEKNSHAKGGKCVIALIGWQVVEQLADCLITDLFAISGTQHLTS